MLCDLRKLSQMSLSLDGERLKLLIDFSKGQQSQDAASQLRTYLNPHL